MRRERPDGQVYRIVQGHIAVDDAAHYSDAVGRFAQVEITAAKLQRSCRNRSIGVLAYTCRIAEHNERRMGIQPTEGSNDRRGERPEVQDYTVIQCDIAVYIADHSAETVGRVDQREVSVTLQIQQACCDRGSLTNRNRIVERQVRRVDVQAVDNIPVKQRGERPDVQGCTVGNGDIIADIADQSAEAVGARGKCDTS